MTALQLKSRLPRVGTTIFTVMSQLALKHGAVNLGQGFPDFNCDPVLQRHLGDAVRAGHNQYAPMAGVPALRAAIAAKNLTLYGHRYDADTEITITAGATLCSAFLPRSSAKKFTSHCTRASRLGRSLTRTGEMPCAP